VGLGIVEQHEGAAAKARALRLDQPSTACIATAASTALPPPFSTRIPAATASGLARPPSRARRARLLAGAGLAVAAGAVGLASSARAITPALASERAHSSALGQERFVISDLAFITGVGKAGTPRKT
jgi:ferric-dicitrate binding protein FerR (iron transport regulator)